LVLGFLVYTFLLMMQFLFRSAEMIIRRDVPAELVGKLLLLTLPNIVVLTIPMSFLFGILVAVGRLSSDSELVAMRSGGISLFSLYRPILVMSLILTIANMFLMVWAVPRGNHSLQSLRLDILSGSVTKQVEPRVFYEDWQGVVLYVFDAPPDTSYWDGVFVARDLESSESEVTVAERGEVRIDEAGDRLLLHLENAVVHKVDFADPEEYNTTRFEVVEQELIDRYTARQRVKVTTSKSVREMTVGELREQLENPKISPELENLTHVEIHKKFAIPVACVVFGLLALPLGYAGGRGSKSSGFAMSIVVIMVYYALLNNGEEMSRVGKMAPWLAMWIPNIVLTIFGTFLLVRRNNDRPLLLGKLDRWLRTRTWIDLKRRRQRSRPERSELRGAQSSSAGQADVLLRLPRLRLRFPNILDRYVLKSFMGVVVLVLLSGVVLYIIADLSERIDDIFKNDVPQLVVVDYYRYLSLQIIYEISPIAVLTTTLVVFGLLSKTNEVTAAKSLGVSLYRIALPAVFASMLIAILAGFLQTTVLPASNERVAQLKDRIKGRQTARSYRRGDRNWLFGQGRYIYNYTDYDDTERSLENLQVFEFNEADSMTRRLFSTKATYLGDTWLFDKGWVRSFEGNEVLEAKMFDQPVIDYYPETPDYFESEYKLPDAMTYRELKSYVAELEASGQSVPSLEVELHKKISLPFASIVMALVALPYAFRLGRKGTLYGVGVGLVLGMVFFAMLAFSSTLGETGALPPLIAVWTPNIAFLMLSLYLLLGVRS
jgi:LPS export ABC transporter permease LptG/LPS export ABC transporter permease LptF